MANDNGDLEIQDDELDVAMKNHRRAPPPDSLLDRCITTVPPTNRLVESAATSLTDSSRPIRQKTAPWFRLGLAASIVIAGSFAYFRVLTYKASGTSDRAVAYLGRGKARESSDDFSLNQGSAPTVDETGRLTRTRDGVENSFEMGEVAGQQKMEALPDGDRPGLWVANSRRGSDGRASREEGAKDSQTSPIESADRFRRGRPYGVNWRSSSADQDHAAPSTQPQKHDVEDVNGVSGITSLRPEAKSESKGNVEPPREEYAEKLHARGYVDLKSVKAADSRGDSRTEEAMQLRQQLKVIREEKERAQKKEFEARQAYIDLEGLQKRAQGRQAALEAREKEIVRILESQERTAAQVPNAEAYSAVADNPFLSVGKCPLSTFSTDVDTASYANVRRFLNQGTLPPKDAVRIEELINYFSYNYPQPHDGDPFSVNLEVAGCPWNGEHRLVRIGLKGRHIADPQRPPANLVFLIDVSGSMQPQNKLPLLKTAMKMLVDRLGENERVAIVTYSHEIRLVLASTTCDSKETIRQALDSLQAAGSTNGGGGIQMAYQVAVENLIQGGVNRVIFATDGDFNVGITDPTELTRFIEEKARSGVFLSVLGFGMGNLKDATLERLADNGNGHYAYIDNIDEARKVLVDQLTGTLVTIAKDVKLQVEFNPRTVSAYRLIGYENRVMPAQDFNDDRRDAGDIGAGHTVTALYEIVPAGKGTGVPAIDPLKYQPQSERPVPDGADLPPLGAMSRELLTVKLRYKHPDNMLSKLMEVPVTDSDRRYGEASSDFKFAAAVAAFGMLLRDSSYRGTATLDGVLELAEDACGSCSTDREGYRSEFLKLVRLARSIRGR